MYVVKSNLETSLLILRTPKFPVETIKLTVYSKVGIYITLRME
jgi:hypothetical protein